MNNRLANERGSALLIALLLTGMLTLVAFIAMDNSNTDMELSYNVMNADRAFYQAEAGAKRALVALNADPDWRTGFADERLGNGSFSVAVIDTSINAALGDTVIIHSTGAAGGGSADVEMWVVPVLNHPFQYGLFGDELVKMENNTCTDSYNSDSGTYAGTQLNDLGPIGSNGAIVMQNAATVGGDASCATAGGISIEGGSQVLGDTTSTADSVTLDIVPDSEYDWARDNSRAPLGFSGGGYNYNAGTKSLIIGEGGSLTLSSGVYYFSYIKIEEDSEIKLAPGAEVTIYLTGDMIMENESYLNPGGSPSDLMIFSDGTSLKLENDSEFYGAFYGPNAEFKIENNTSLYGAVVAKRTILENFACFHYDRHLGNFTKGQGDGFQVVAWREL